MSLLADVDDLAGGHAGHVELADGVGGGLGEVDLDFLVLELTIAEHAAELGAGVRTRLLAGEGGDQAFLGGEFGLGLDVAAAGVAQHGDAGLDEVADDGFDVAADIADLGELGGLDLEEGGLGELGEAAGDLGLAAAGGADHEDVLGHDLLAHGLGQLLAAPAVAERDGDGALGVGLADDKAVELGDDLAGGVGGGFHGAGPRKEGSSFL